MALYLEDLEQMGCMHGGHPEGQDCESMFFSGRCHPGSPTTTSFIRSGKLVRIVCAKCKKLVAEVAVGPRNRS